MLRTDRGRISLVEISVLLLVVILSIVTAMTIFFDPSRPEYYEWLPVLPLSFALINIFTFKIYQNIFKKVAYIILISLYMVRNVVTPLIMRFGNYLGVFQQLYPDNVNKAIAFMIYETLVVFVFLLLIDNNIIKIRKFIIKGIALRQKQIKLFRIALLFIIGICIFAYITVPEIRLTYTSIFDQNVVGSLNATELLPGGSNARMLYTLFIFFFNMLQIYVSMWLIRKIRRLVGANILSLVLSLMVIFCQFLFMSEENGYTFIVVFILVRIIYQLYTKYRRLLTIIMGISFSIGLLSIYLLKSSLLAGTAASLEVLSIMFQAYLPGICNIASVFNMNNPNKLSTLFFDFYTMIPFRETIFGLTGERLSIVYNIQNGVNAQILPCIGQAYHYLGFVLAPIVPCFFVYIGVKYQMMLKSESNIWKQATYTLLCIFSVMTPVMYNATIFGSRFLNTIFPMMILSKFDGNNRSCDERIKSIG